jgi:hypothetical protein
VGEWPTPASRSRFRRASLVDTCSRPGAGAPTRETENSGMSAWRRTMPRTFSTRAAARLIRLVALSAD